jgi:glucose dehydrogenase
MLCAPRWGWGIGALPWRSKMKAYAPQHSCICGPFVRPFLSSSRERNTPGEWPTYNHDLAGTRYSPLTQINASNGARLTQAWVYRPSATGGHSSGEVTPIVVNGVMYLTAGNRVVAMQPETGKENWRYELQSGQALQRGVAYWPGDYEHPPRILFTAGRRLIALNAIMEKRRTDLEATAKSTW